jgi:MFS family permease
VADEPCPGASPRVIIAVLATAGTVASLMHTLIVPLLGELPRIVHSNAANASWAVTATLLAAAVATPVAGRLGDLYGKRRMLLLCCAALVAGSIVCALADSLASMIIGRALQGAGSGVIPLGISALRDLLPAHRLGSGIALISSSLGIGGALGLPISAAVAQYADWRILFWSVAGLNVLVAVLIWRLVPGSPASAGGRFDFAGACGLGIGLVCLLLGVSKGGDWGWASGITLGLFAATLVVLLVWGWWELRIPNPLVDLRITARRQVLLTNTASIVIGFALYAQLLIIPRLRQLPVETGYGLGQSMLAAGLWLAPGGLIMMAVSPLGARLSDARGPKVTLFVGTLVIAAGYGASLPLLGSSWGLLIVTCVCSLGVALAYGAMPALIMGAVPTFETASANSFNTLMRAIGTTTSAAVVGVLLASTTTQLGGHPMPAEGGFRIGMLIGCGVAILAAVITLAIPGRRAESHPHKERDPPAPSRERFLVQQQRRHEHADDAEESVHRGSGVRQGPHESRPSRDVVAGAALGLGAAADQVLNLPVLDPGPRQGGGDRVGGEVLPLGVVERPRVGLPDGGARSGDDDGFPHRGASSSRSVRVRAVAGAQIESPPSTGSTAPVM